MSVFPMSAQILYIYISDKADWYRDKEYWTGPRGKYCLCDAGYAGSNNSMGTEVDWRNIKKQVPPFASLGTFLGGLCEFIKQLAIEHKAFKFLANLGDPFNFPEVIKPGKPIWDRIQGMHPKTAVLSWVMEGTTRFVNDFPPYVHEVYRQGEPTTPLHLKIWLSHDVRKRAGRDVHVTQARLVQDGVDACSAHPNEAGPREPAPSGGRDF
jgi:hypothetical protein